MSPPPGSFEPVEAKLASAPCSSRAQSESARSTASERLARAADTTGGRAEQEQDERRAVRQLRLPLSATCKRRVRVCRHLGVHDVRKHVPIGIGGPPVVLAHARGEQAGDELDRSEVTAAKDLPQLERVAVEMPRVADDHLAALPTRCSEQATGVGRVEHHRLLDQHVGAVRDPRACDLVVRRVRGDDHAVVAAVVHLVVGCERGLHAEARRCLAPPRSARIGERHDLGIAPRRQRRQVRLVRP